MLSIQFLTCIKLHRAQYITQWVILQSRDLLWGVFAVHTNFKLLYGYGTFKLREILVSIKFLREFIYIAIYILLTVLKLGYEKWYQKHKNFNMCVRICVCSPRQQRAPWPTWRVSMRQRSPWWLTPWWSSGMSWKPWRKMPPLSPLCGPCLPPGQRQKRRN